MRWPSLAAALALALVHLSAGRLRFLDVIPRSRWLSFGSGVSVAYVFVHVLPELADSQRHFARTGLVAGWLVDATLDVHPAALAALFAFLAGGVLLNVLKEELPAERESAFWAFALGAVGYAALLLLA